MALTAPSPRRSRVRGCRTTPSESRTAKLVTPSCSALVSSYASVFASSTELVGCRHSSMRTAMALRCIAILSIPCAPGDNTRFLRYYSISCSLLALKTRSSAYGVTRRRIPIHTSLQPGQHTPITTDRPCDLYPPLSILHGGTLSVPSSHCSLKAFCKDSMSNLLLLGYSPTHPAEFFCR